MAEQQSNLAALNHIVNEQERNFPNQDVMHELHQAAIACFLKNLNRKQRVALGQPEPKLRVKIGKFGFSKNWDFIFEQDELRSILVIEAKDKAHLSTLMLLAKGYRVAAAAAGFSRFGIAQCSGALFCCWDCP